MKDRMRKAFAKEPMTKEDLRPIFSTIAGDINEAIPQDKYTSPSEKNPRSPNPEFYRISDMMFYAEL
jgi:hypothetical protein